MLRFFLTNAFIVISVFIFCVPNAFSREVSWGKDDLWERSMIQSVDFFNRFARDANTGSYASEINVDGSRKSETRHLIALSRMIYGLSHSSRYKPENLIYAKQAAAFMLKNMVKRDNLGPYFISAVDVKGNSVINQSVLEVNEQAYGLNGLVALYQVTKDQKLLQIIRELYMSFYRRFHDNALNGFFDGYNIKLQKPVLTKSYNSTVYVATAFLIELAEADKQKQADYLSVITELADAVTTYFPDDKTGWIIENFTSDWKPDWRDWQKQGEFTIGIVGHNFQAAWFLLRAAEMVKDKNKTLQYNKTAHSILISMLAKPVIDWKNGGVFDAYKRETSEPMWHTNKAWWQQAEAILALTLAEKRGVLADTNASLARNKTMEFYFQHFIDKQVGGEFDVVDQEGNPVSDAMKGHRGKSTYHTVELARYMLKYAK